MFLLGMWTTGAWAQTVTLSPVAYGTVTTAGVQVANSLTGIEELTSRRGWFKFDLSSVPGGATITSANLTYSTASGTVNSGATNNALNKATDDLSLITGSTLFARCAVGGNTTNLFTGAWSGTHPLTLQTNGPTGGNATVATNIVTFLSGQQAANYACFSLVRGSTNSYNFGLPQLVINYTGGSPCAGVPAPGNTLSTTASACSGASFTLSLQNATLGSGVTYQWEADNGGGFTAISGATASSLTTTQTAASSYRCLVTCSSGPNSTYSNPITVGLTTGVTCLNYCAAVTTNTADEEIYQVTINGSSTPSTYANTNGCTNAAPGAGSILSRYSNFWPLGSLTVVQQGQIVSFQVRENECDGATFYANGIAIYIDYNQNGSFADAGEAVYLENTTTAATGATPGGDKVVSGTFTVPLGATLGQTGMRIIASEGVAAPGPCAAPSYGEVEDWLITISASTACTGTPAPGNTLSSAGASVCSGISFTLSLQNPTLGSGVTYQWYADAGSGYAPISGATSSTYTATQTVATSYYCEVTCSGGGTGSSTPVAVSMNPFYNCYCTTGLGGSCGINALSSVAIATTTLNNVTGGCTGTYNAFPASGSTTASLVAGTPYTMTAGCIAGSNTQVAVWIDANQNGIYETSEYTLINGNIPSGSTGTGSFTIPISALPGTTGMRVRSDWQGTTAWTSADACTNRTWGETEDYTITVLIPGNCSGTPASSVTTASVTNSCPGGSVSLGTNPVYSDAGLTFDWQSSPDGVTYTSTGVTTSTYTATGFSATTWYQCVITCTNGGSPVTSTPVQVTLNPFYNCYCTTNLHTSSSPCIDQIDLNTLSNNTAGAGCALPAYSQQSATTTVFQGNSYTFTRVATFAGAWTGLWIDYDHSGTFDASEYTQVSSTGTGAISNSVTITIPVTALTGNTGMRIRQRTVDMLSTDACTQGFGSGETEDYVVDIQTPVGCTGTPAASNTVSSSPSVCSGVSFNLSMSVAYTASGITYQWQSSPDGVTYTDISGATSQFYSASQTATTWYQCIVTCTNSSQSITSTPVQVTMNSFLSCYCASVATNTADEEIYSVTVNGASTPTAYAGSNGCTTPAPGAGSLLNQYSNFTSLGTFTSLLQGVSVPFSIVQDECDGATYYSNGIAIFIDYDQSGTYEMSEQVFAEPITSTGPRTVSGSFTVPFTALTGQTGMRVICAEGFSGTGLTGCLAYGYGETEDYIVDIIVPVGCTGTPSAANTISSSASVCPGSAFTLSLSTNYALSGITYQWQSSPDGVTYTDISGATGFTYGASQTAATWYQCIVTCTNSSLSITSTPVQVTMSSLTSCYCVAGATTDGIGTSNEYVGNVTFNTINNTSTNPADPANQYTDYTSIITSVQVGNTYTASVLIPNWFSGDQAAVWIDFNQDGTFNTTTEQFLLLSGGTSGSDPFTGNITIPGSALTGTTRMRVRGNYTGAMSPCGITTYGEVEDYSVNITPATCVLAPTYPADGTNGCPNGNLLTLSWPALAGATGYDVYVGTTTPPTTLVSANQAGLTFDADISGGAPTYYWMVVPQITGSTGSCSIWSFGVNPAPDPVASTGGDPCEGTTLGLIGDNIAPGQSSGNTYQWSGPSFSSTQQNPLRSNATLAYAGTYTLTVTNSFLCSATTTVSVVVNPNPTLSQVSYVNVGCIGGSDGEMTVVGNTTGPFDYTTDFITFNQDGYFTGLPTGPTTYYVSDANGCSGQGNFSLTYTSTVPPSANVIVPFIGMPTNVCNGTSAVLSIPAVSNTTKYIWDAPTGAYFNGNPLNVSPFTTTTPSVQITWGNPSGSLYVTGVQAANGCGASLRKIQKTRGTISVPASISGSLTMCASTTGTYSTPPVDAASSYEWSITGDATVTGTGTTATVTFGPTWTSGTLCVAAKTSCYKSALKCIEIGNTAAALNNLSGAFTACPNQTLTYSVAPSSGAASYNWTLPSGATGSSTTNSISAAFGAGYSAVGSVCVNVTSICGVTSATKCKTVAPGLPAQPSSISGALSGVCNQTIVYGCPPVSGTTYNWTTPSGTIIQSGQGTSNISAHFSALTTGNVCVTATNSCGSSISRCVPVKGAPNAPGAITPTPSSWCAGDQIEFAVNTSAMSGAFTLNWAYPPASVATYVIGGGNSNSLILDWIGGSGAVNVTASNACGGATKPSTWSSSCREGAIAEVNALSVSPNPTTGILNISYTATKGHTRLMVLDLAGRVVMNEQIASIEGSNNTQLDMSRLAKGAYMLSVQSTQGNKQVRVVVE